MDTHASERTLQQILYGGASLRRVSISELSRVSPVLVVFLRETNGVEEALRDLEWLEQTVAECTLTQLVIVHRTDDLVVERLLSAHRLGHAFRIFDPQGHLHRVFREHARAGARTALVEGPYVVSNGRILNGLDSLIEAA